nr:zinc finger and BTB domain-containing protein 24-like [Nerophis lumbriciformis]
MTLMASSPSYKTRILNKLACLRERDVLCDITLLADGECFRAHKALLAASSDYFSQLFTANYGATCRLDGVAAAACGAVLEFIYSSQVCVEEGAGDQLLAAAQLLKVGDLVEALQTTPRCKTARVASGSLVKNRRKKSPSCGAGAEKPPRVDDDGEEGKWSGRSGKRKITLPVKYDAYKVGGEVSVGGGEKAKRCKKRKSPDIEIRCHDCGKGFKNHLFLKIHQRTHTGEKPFSCQTCGAAFTQKHTLLVHQRKHTGETPFVCSVCSKALATKHSLREHMNLHQDNKAFCCDKCEKRFTQKRQLRSHYRVHTGKSLPECAQCQRKFLDTAQLKKHLRTHTGEKPFTCEICGKCFSVKSTLQTHIRIHRGEKPYRCGLCDKSFSDCSAHRRHVASHSGKKPFNCSACGLSFTRLDNLKTHINTHNKERVFDPPPGGERSGGLPAECQLATGSDQDLHFVVAGDNISSVSGQTSEINPIQMLGESGAESSHVITFRRDTTEHPHGQQMAPQHVHLNQAISISQTTQHISGQHIQGHTFQIQAGTVSCLYAATGPPPAQS